MPIHLQFSLLPDYIIEVHDNISHTCPEEVNCWVGNLFHKYYQELLNSENVEDRYSYIQRNKWPDDNLTYIYFSVKRLEESMP